jgi:hypothetical protein
LCRIKARDGAKDAGSSGNTGGIANGLYAAYILSNNKNLLRAALTKKAGAR